MFNREELICHSGGALGSDLVLDNCAGSGTTGIAAINTTRNYIMIENNENHFNLINKRIEETLTK